ncbi:MFS transporter [Pseudonocardia nigra]|uniref:MFS transporter n=1 Tax=Pseudonocardia nigra TaxID=1921578 RepID=UPI001C5EF84F|nr:MFS transporter [Pseudonocardia nigra]
MRPGLIRKRHLRCRGTHLPGGARRGFVVLWLGQFTAIAGLTVVVPLLPFYLAGLGVPEHDVPWWTAVSLAAPAVTQMITAPLWGIVGDRYGRKAMVVRAHAGLALAVGLMALADGPEEFLGYRLLQGACGGVVGATATFASSLAPAQRRGRALGGLFGAVAAGSLVGPLAGSLLATGYGYGALFGAIAALLALSSLSALVLLREPAGGPRAAGAPEAGGPTLWAAAAELLRSLRSRHLLMAGVAGQAGVYALLVLFAPRVAQVTGSVAAATVWVGILQAVTWAASLVGGPWWGHRNDRHRPELGFAMAAAGCGLAVALQAVPVTAAGLLPLRVAQGFCFAALVPSVQHVISRLVAERARGAGLGIAQALLDLGQVLGPLLGALAAALLPAPAAFATVGVLFGLASALALAGDRAARRDATTTPEHSRPALGGSR